MYKFIVLLMLLSGFNTLIADDVTDWIDDGLKSYKSGNYSESATSLEYAVQLIRQMKGTEMGGAFPAALDGWTKLDSENAASEMSVFGGSGAVALYEKTVGGQESSCSISASADHPMMGSMLMMFNTPMMMRASGMKMIKIADQKGSLEYDKSDNSGQIMVVIDKQVLVLVEGEGITEDELRAYAKGVDYELIKKSNSN
jgi:hypothetical protein